MQQDGTMQNIILQAKFVPGLWVNLFSITKAIKGGAKIDNEDMVITVKKGKTVVKFDKIFETKGGFLGGVEICP